MNDFLKRTWAEINLDNLNYNIQSIKNKLNKNTQIIAVVKANAYGHGDKVIAKALSEYGVNYFAVSNLDEALSLRETGIKSDVLILGFTPENKADVLAKMNITQTIVSYEYANSLNKACEEKNVSVNVHIKLDTGMSRIGLIHNEKNDATEQIEKIYNMSNLNCTGIFTHFSSADTLDEESIEYTKNQKKYFDDAVLKTKQKGLEFSQIHIQNSAGISFIDNNATSNYTHARAGIVMYGLPPSEENIDIPIKPVMELKSVISMVKEVDKGTSISYGRHFVTTSTKKIATIPIGYADGYPRLLSNKGEMLIKGRRAKILGNVCMDQLMLDVSQIDDVKENDLVTIIGCDQNEKITFWDLANQIGTIGYELMCLISRRVPRIYIKDGKTVDVVEYIVK